MKLTTKLHLLIPALLLCLCLSGGCSQDSGSSSVSAAGKTPRDNTPVVLVPEASGEISYGNETVTIDASHTSDGYFMVNYQPVSEKIKLQLTTPDGTVYSYQLNTSGNYETFPLTGGSGSYHADVLQNVSGDMYAVVFSQDFDAEISDEFLPFLYPNQYVNFTADSDAVKKASELAGDTSSDLEVIENIYNYVTKNITYDDAKAQSVTAGYLPDIDETLSSGTGICFDYASLMTSMLRTQRIPTRLEVGYAGSAYHAWISAYTEETGWVDKIIEFDGKNWKLMDPTLAASNDNKAVVEYIGDGSSYTLKYTY